MSTPTLPDRSGHFGEFGGKFVIETLMPALQELEKLYNEARNDPEFQKQLRFALRSYILPRTCQGSWVVRNAISSART
jgi:tryptophan synthase beta chain